MQRLEYSDLACYLQADDLEPLPTDIFDFIDELELHDCAHSQPNRAGALPGKLVAPVDQGQVQPAGGAGAGSPPGSNKVTDSRIDRIRQRNREAQARFRLKQKVCTSPSSLPPAHCRSLLVHWLVSAQRL